MGFELPDRVLDKFEVGPGCWEWTASRQLSGHGSVGWQGKVVRPHRLVYEASVGPIPEGLEIDHLCRNRACVNPDHLEPVTRRENQLRGYGFSGINARKTHCRNGHEYNQTDTHYSSDNRRVCRICRATNARALRARQKAGRG